MSLPRLFIDADACPVKDEVYRVAARYGLHVFVVSNGWINTQRQPAARQLHQPGPHRLGQGRRVAGVEPHLHRRRDLVDVLAARPSRAEEAELQLAFRDDGHWTTRLARTTA